MGLPSLLQPEIKCSAPIAATKIAQCGMFRAPHAESYFIQMEPGLLIARSAERNEGQNHSKSSGAEAAKESNAKSDRKMFEVKCYRNNHSYYLGTYDTLDSAISARDRFLSAPDADLEVVAAAIKAENSGRKQQSYLLLKGETP
ncbi:MAG: hypothetical protein ACI3XQ_00340 [Eubacteriales bacterium]